MKRVRLEEADEFAAVLNGFDSGKSSRPAPPKGSRQDFWRNVAPDIIAYRETRERTRGPNGPKQNAGTQARRSYRHVILTFFARNKNLCTCSLSYSFGAPVGRPGTQDDDDGAGLDDLYQFGDNMFFPADDDDAPSDRAPRHPPPPPDAWTDGGVHDRFVENFLGAAANLSKRTRAALREKADTIEKWAATFTCPCCRGDVEPSGNDGSQRCIVTLVGLESMLNVHIPIGMCFVCKKKSHVSPINVGFFPSTLQQALDLTTVSRRSAVPPIWFSTQLLDWIVGSQVCALLEGQHVRLC